MENENENGKVGLPPIVPPVEKKVDESFKKEVEAEKQEEVKIEMLKLQDVINSIPWDKDKRPTEIPAHAKVMIIVYDDLTRNAICRRVHNMNSFTDTINILRDSVFQLEQMEISQNMLANTMAIMRDECARLWAKISGNGRR